MLNRPPHDMLQVGTYIGFMGKNPAIVDIKPIQRDPSGYEWYLQVYLHELPEGKSQLTHMPQSEITESLLEKEFGLTNLIYQEIIPEMGPCYVEILPELVNLY